jgi:hypothetical protein
MRLFDLLPGLQALWILSCLDFRGLTFATIFIPQSCNLSNYIRRIKITGKMIMLIGITFAVLTWGLLYGRAGGIGGLIMFLGALSYSIALGV